MQRQQRRVEADRAVRRRVARRLGHEDVDEGHDHQIGVVTGQRVQRRLVVEICRLINGQAFFQREFLDRIDRLAVFVGLAIDGDDLVLAVIQKLGQNVLAERLLTHDDRCACLSLIPPPPC